MPSLGDTAKKQRIKYFLISFLDLFGTMRAKIVPAGAIDAVAKSGAGFAGFATWFDMTPADPDILAMPDPDSLIQLPWKPEVAWVAADLVMGGKEVAQTGLSAQRARSRDRGFPRPRDRGQARGDARRRGLPRRPDPDLAQDGLNAPRVFRAAAARSVAKRAKIASGLTMRPPHWTVGADDASERCPGQRGGVCRALSRGLSEVPPP
jgi:hypothetical protein